MNIIEAIKDPNLFRPFLADTNNSLKSWSGWLSALRALYGLSLPTRSKRFLSKCTGLSSWCTDGYTSALFLTGRRSGKSRTSAVIAAYEGALAGHEKRLSKGERGIVACLAPTRAQGRIVKEYIRGIFDTPLLRPFIVKENKEGFELKNGITIEIHTGDFRSARGFTLVAAIVDEVCFFGIEEEAKVKSDVELVRAIKPALLTTGGKLIAISSPYARKGWAFKTYEKNYANDNGTTLVLNAPSRTLNPTLSQKEIDKAIADDPAAARSEYFGEFRDDIMSFISRELVEALVVEGRREIPPQEGIKYAGFVDVSGGRRDDAAIAIAHGKGRNVILDYVRRWRSPFNPYEVIGDMVQDLRQFGCNRVTGDNYSAEFVASAFKMQGIHYDKADRPKSQLYAELYPRLSSGEIELLDHEEIVDQISNLERRTRSGGRDTIDHPQGQHDDVANVVAGVTVCAVKRKRIIGAR